MSDLERSDSYYRKICMLQHGFLPKQSEIRHRLGKQLSRVFFESCLPALQPYLGLCPALWGPGVDLWVSPSDLLIGKVRLKPPLTRKHVQALTHQGILEIGQEIEKKFIQEFENEKILALAENEEMLRYLADKEKKEALNKLKEEERIKREEMAERMRQEFKLELEEELRKLEEYLEEQKIIAVEEGKRETEKMVQEKLEIAVQETVTRLTLHFAMELIKQSKCLHKHFWYHIKEEKNKLKATLEEQKAQCQEQLQKLHTELQCENVANIMYVLAQERRRCMCEKQQLEQNFLAKLLKLEKELEERSENLKRTTSEMERLGHEVEARDAAMFEIIKQFQKFIYFVLKAVPTQAEYLLNVEKLMIFELTNTVIQTKPSYFTEARASTVAANERLSVTQSMVYPAHHDCDNQIKYVPSAATLTSEEDLPGFVYNENLYLREDFRNMISQGLRISRSNELWNFDVADIQCRLSGPDEQTKYKCPSERRSLDKSLINVRFSQKFQEILIDEKVLKTTSFTVVEKDSLDANIHDSIQVAKDEESSSTASLTVSHVAPSKISLAKDSVELMKIKSNMSRPSVNISNKVPKTDSKLLAIKKSYDSKIGSTKEILSHKGKDSKLELAVDSVALMRSNATLRSQAQCVYTVLKKEAKKDLVDIGIQAEGLTKAVTVSHIEIIAEKDAAVSFHDKPKIIPPTEEPEPPIPCEKLPRKWVCPEELYKKPSSVKVLGDPDSTAHLEYQDEFVAKRINSFITIFRNNPSLRRLFTQVKNK